MSKNTFTLIILFSIIFIVDKARSQCVYDLNEFSLNCENFTTLTEIQIPAELNNDKNKIDKIYLKPSESIILDTENINLNNIEGKVNKNYSAILSNFNSVNFLLNPFEVLMGSTYGGYRRLYLQNDFILKFIISSNDLNSNCNLNRNDLITNHLFFGFKEIYMQGLDFNQIDALCPLVFNKVEMAKLVIEEMSAQNQIKFIELLPNDKKKLNAKIDRLELLNSDLQLLDESVLEKNVFSALKHFIYHEHFESETEDNETLAEEIKYLEIKEELFVPLTKLEEVELSLNNFVSFVQNASLNWLNYGLNQNLSVNEVKLVLKDNSKSYDYPEDDFCFFKDFPHNRNIFPIIHTNESLACTCTLKYLLKNIDKYSDKNEMLTDSVKSCASDEDVICDFKALTKQCNDRYTTSPKSTTMKPSTTDKMTTTFTLKFVNETNTKPETDYVPTIIATVVGAVALLVSLAIIFYAVNLMKNTPKPNRVKSAGDELVNSVARY